MLDLNFLEAFNKLDTLNEDDQNSGIEAELQKFIDAGAPVLDTVPEMVADDCNLQINEGDYFTSKDSLTSHYYKHTMRSYNDYSTKDTLFPKSWCNSPEEYLERAKDLAKAPIVARTRSTASTPMVAMGFVCQDTNKDNWEDGDPIDRYKNGLAQPDKHSIWIFCKYRYNNNITCPAVQDELRACELVYYVLDGKSLVIKSYMLKSPEDIESAIKSGIYAHNSDKNAGARVESRFKNEIDAEDAAITATRQPVIITLSLISNSDRCVGVRFNCTNATTTAANDYAETNASDDSYNFLCCFFNGTKIQLIGSWVANRKTNKQNTDSPLYKLAVSRYYHASPIIEKIRNRIANVIVKDDMMINPITDNELVAFINRSLDDYEYKWSHDSENMRPNKKDPTRPPYPGRRDFLYRRQKGFTFDVFH